MSRIRRTLLAIMMGRGLIAARQILVVPILLKAWGIDYYGNWLLLSTIPSFLAMSNLGLGTSAATQIATRTGNDIDLANRRTLATAWGIILTVYVIVVIGLFLWSSYFATSFTDLQYGFPVLMLLVLGLFVRMMAQPIPGWWISNGLASRSIQLNNVFTVVELLIYIVIPLLGGKALLLTSLAAGWTCLWFIFYIAVTIRTGSQMFRPQAPSVAEAKLLLRIGIGHQLSPLWQGLLFQGSIVLAGHLLGSSGAALWGALRVVNRAGNQFLELVSQTAGPEFQRNHAANDTPANSKLHAQSILISLTISSLACLGLMICGSLVFRYWTHNAFAEPRAIWWIMPAGLVPFALWWISSEYQRSINRPWGINLCGVFAACASLSVTWLLQSYGILAFAIGGVVFELIMVAYVLPKTLRLLGDSFETFLGKMLVASQTIYHRKFGS